PRAERADRRGAPAPGTGARRPRRPPPAPDPGPAGAAGGHREARAIMNTLMPVRGLRKRFCDTEVIQGVDLDIHVGEVVEVIGPSGWGKPTLIRCLIGLEPDTPGEIAPTGAA